MPESPSASPSRRIRVFISSTFRDMVEERDALQTHTWPQLRRLCRERQVELVEVDLRWGISEEQSTRRETLKLCLDEIRACRPFFVGLLGERYGWVPDEDAFSADLREEQPWLRDLRDRSVTELEILHGVLNNPGMAARAFFYFRDPAWAAAHGADFQSESAAAAGKQATLKSLIRATCAAGGIPLREDYPDPRALADLVLADLTAAIEEQYPVAGIPDPLDREARDNEAFAETRRRTYIGRPDYFAALDRHAAGDGGPLVLVGESGGGKSALLANWTARWKAAHPDDFILQHYIGGTPDSSDHWRLMSRVIEEIRRWTSDPEPPPRAPDDILRTFPEWLARARLHAEQAGVRFILVLDALNQLADQDRARRLGWLPSQPFSGPLRLFASTLPGETLEAVSGRGWPSLRVEPLTGDERRRMIADYLGRFGKTLDGLRLERLAAAPAAANPLHLKILLDELRVTGTHERLDERLADYLAAADIPTLLGRVLSRYRHDYEGDRPGLVGEALGAIWGARRGLAETELLHLLGPPSLPQLPPAVWAPLRAALEEGLVDRGGILNFAHEFLRTAVETAFVPDAAVAKGLRLRLADEFDASPAGPRSCDELPWLLWMAEERARLRACLLDIDRHLEIRRRDMDEPLRYWVWLGEEREMGPAYLAAFEQWAAGPTGRNADQAHVAIDLANLLYDGARYAEAEQLMRRALALREEEFGGEHVMIAPALNDLAFLLEATGRPAEAEPLFRRALAINESALGPEDPAVSINLNNLASLLQATSRPEEAEPLFRRALAINEKSYGPEHPTVAITVNTLAHLFQATGRQEEAEPLFRRALAIWEKTLGPDHPYVAGALNNLAETLRLERRFTEAEPLLRRALAKWETSLGENHPNVAAALSNLALLMGATGRPAEAEPLIRRALAIDEATHGPDHPMVAVRLNNLASLLVATGRAAEAEPPSRRMVEILLRYTRAAGHPHPHFQMAVMNHAVYLRKMGLAPPEILAKLEEIGPEVLAVFSAVLEERRRGQSPGSPAR